MLFRLIFLFVVVLTTSCSLSPPEQRDEGSVIIDQTLGMAAKVMEDKHNMCAGSTTVAAMNQIEKLGLSFHVFRKLTKGEARAIILECVKDMIEVVNNNEAIQPYLAEDGFTEKNVQIVLHMYSKKKPTCYPDLGTAAITNCFFRFFTNDPDEKYTYKTKEYEKFETAISLNEEYQKQKQNVI